KPGSSAIQSTDHPVRLLERGENVCPVRIRQRALSSGQELLVSELRHRSAQLRTPGEDDRALDEVLQLPDVARPVVLLERANHVVRDELDRLALPPGEGSD